MRRLEERNKGLNNRGDYVAQVLKRWNDRFVPGRSNLVEHYLAGNVWMRLHVRVLGEPRYLDVGVRAGIGGLAGDVDALTGGGPEATGYDVIEFCSTGDDDQQAVLVGNVKFMDEPEGMIERRRVPCVVGLNVPYGAFGINGHALYFSLVSHLILVGRAEDRELGLGCGACVISQDEPISDVIEGRPEMVDYFSGPHAQRYGRLDASDSANDILRRFLVLIHPDGRFCVYQESGDKTIQVDDVLVGPLNLVSRAVERMM